MLTVYGKPGCGQCVTAKKLLQDKGIVFEYVDISNDVTTLLLVKNLGFKSLPVIVGSNSMVVGGLKELAALLSEGDALD